MKDSNRVSGTSRTSCPFYDEIDAILGTRAASTPAVLLESGSSVNPDENSGRCEIIVCCKNSPLVVVEFSIFLTATGDVNSRSVSPSVELDVEPRASSHGDTDVNEGLEGIYTPYHSLPSEYPPLTLPPILSHRKN